MDSDSDEVLLQIKNNVGYVTLNRPSRGNALNSNMGQRLQEIFMQYGCCITRFLSIYTYAGLMVTPLYELLFFQGLGSISAQAWILEVPINRKFSRVWNRFSLCFIPHDVMGPHRIGRWPSCC